MYCHCNTASIITVCDTLHTLDAFDELAKGKTNLYVELFRTEESKGVVQ